MTTVQSELLNKASLELERIEDRQIRQVIQSLLSIIEEQAQTIEKLRAENQSLRDENNRLKGEQGKPDIKPKNRNRDISSEKERQPKDKPKRKKGTKKDKIKINRTETCRVDKSQLPPDAEFKGYQSVVVQDLKIQTDNIEFKKEVFYSSSENKSYLAPLPQGYEGEFGPRVKALALVLKNVCNLSEPKILEFFENCQIRLSKGKLSDILIGDIEAFHTEKQELFEAGLTSTPYQHIDDTSARVRGENHYTHIVCNDFYTAYFTTERKNRLQIIEILQNRENSLHCLNPEAFALMGQLKVGTKAIEKLRTLESETLMEKQELLPLLTQRLPQLKEKIKTKILEASAIAAYHNTTVFQPIQILLCDDAPQFKMITEELALCWIHDGRHYKKLSPVVPLHVKKLEMFLTRFWDYYHQLLAYKETPNSQLAEELSLDFDQLFSTQTGYQALDERIAKTKEKKVYLLLVLKYPQIPLHNNPAEIEAKMQVRKRDVSLHTMTPEGTKANDTFLSIVQTCKKLRLNAYEYFFDRISKKHQIQPLANLIRSRSLP